MLTPGEDPGEVVPATMHEILSKGEPDLSSLVSRLDGIALDTLLDLSQVNPSLLESQLVDCGLSAGQSVIVSERMQFVAYHRIQDREAAILTGGLRINTGVPSLIPETIEELLGGAGGDIRLLGLLGQFRGMNLDGLLDLNKEPALLQGRLEELGLSGEEARMVGMRIEAVDRQQQQMLAAAGLGV